jgi:hypothetical protein
MPTGFVKKMAKKHGMSIKKSEQLWNRAKAQADGNWALVTNIYKKMLGENFKKYLDMVGK